MGRPEKPVNASGGAVAAFANDLRRLRLEAGRPTYRDMARSALFSSSVLSNAASGRRLPTLPVALAFVAACGGDREVWRHRWLQVSGDVSSSAPAARPAYRDFPGRRTLPRPAQLPLRPRGFVGRVDERRQLGIPSTAPVVINGPVGVGKTELALYYAHDLAAGMVDGELYADLGPLASAERGAQDLINGFLRALGVPPEQLSGSPGQQAGLFRSLLAERRLVVLLDNVRGERQVRPLLAEARHSVTIVVSRTALPGLRDVRRVRLDVLPRTDSVAMITAAVPDRAEADPEACDRLADLCGDLPLALDIATRKLAARPDIPLRRIIDRLAEPGVMLDWLHIGDLSVRESLNSAYLQLGEPAKVLLRRLAKLPADEPVVRAYRGPDSAVPIDEKLVEELAEASMLCFGDRPGGYRLGPFVRAFAVDAARRVDVPPDFVDLPAARHRLRTDSDPQPVLTSGLMSAN